MWIALLGFVFAIIIFSELFDKISLMACSMLSIGVLVPVSIVFGVQCGGGNGGGSSGGGGADGVESCGGPDAGRVTCGSVGSISVLAYDLVPVVTSDLACGNETFFS